MITPKLSDFKIGDTNLSVRFVETMEVKEGVECDVYVFVDDSSQDLAIVRVTKGFKTPLQRILKGTKTTEGFMSGRGILTITSKDESSQKYAFPNEDISEVAVEVGQIMQWSAEDDLVFYEICEPPYEDGRFENLPESS